MVKGGHFRGWVHGGAASTPARRLTGRDTGGNAATIGPRLYSPAIDFPAYLPESAFGSKIPHLVLVDQGVMAARRPGSAGIQARRPTDQNWIKSVSATTNAVFTSRW